eukprot:TRINITY_DN3756_c0_g1_i1.p1 TRINITY_DN3756_c0_g1~~TRINITY_DN3756_c0_g1_i1.p1  ORF type:complete len:738 (-),score=121.08 TRINITY_DN3756_c0_g1_i1:161-2374(-)
MKNSGSHKPQKRLPETEAAIRQFFRPGSRGESVRASDQAKMEQYIAAINFEIAPRSAANEDQQAFFDIKPTRVKVGRENRSKKKSSLTKNLSPNDQRKSNMRAQRPMTTTNTQLSGSQLNLSENHKGGSKDGLTSGKSDFLAPSSRNIITALLKKKSDLTRSSAKQNLNLSGNAGYSSQKDPFHSLQKIYGATNASPKLSMKGSGAFGSSTASIQKKLVKAYLTTGSGKQPCGLELLGDQFYVTKVSPLTTKAASKPEKVSLPVRSRDNSPEQTRPEQKLTNPVLTANYYLAGGRPTAKGQGSTKANVSAAIGNDSSHSIPEKGHNSVRIEKGKLNRREGASGHPVGQFSFSGNNGPFKQNPSAAQGEEEFAIDLAARLEEAEQLTEVLSGIKGRVEDRGQLEALMQRVNSILSDYANLENPIPEILERTRYLNEQVYEIFRKQLGYLKYLESENKSALKEKASQAASINKLKAKVMELAEVKTHYENRINDMERELASRKTKPGLGLNLDLRTLLEENEELKDVAKHQNKVIMYLKTKEVKLLKLLYVIKKEGVDIDSIYSQHIDEIQREDEDGEMFQDDSEMIEEDEEQGEEMKHVPKSVEIQTGDQHHEQNIASGDEEEDDAHNYHATEYSDDDIDPLVAEKITKTEQDENANFRVSRIPLKYGPMSPELESKSTLDTKTRNKLGQGSGSVLNHHSVNEEKVVFGPRENNRKSQLRQRGETKEIPLVSKSDIID